MVKNCFASSPVFERARHFSFENFLNKNRDTNKVNMSEVMAVYTDIILRKSGMRIEESKQEEYLEKVVKLFTHLIDKDIFIEVYRSYLAKRLLLEKSESVELERSMISFIKMSCGPQFTKKLEGMLTDLMLAAEEQKKFDVFRQESGQSALATAFNRDIDFNITILTTSYWPTYKTFDIQIPLEIDCRMKHFNTYYTQKYTHRQLQWCYSMGNATIGAKFGKDFDLVVGTYQLCLIMLFNNRREYKYIEIKDMMKFDDETCSKNLRSLMTPKLKLLEVHGLGSKSQSNFQPDDVISVNENFTSSFKKNVFPLPVLEEVFKKGKQ